MIMVIYYQIKQANAFATKAKVSQGILKKKDANAERIPGIYNLLQISNLSLIFQENVWVAIQYLKDVTNVTLLKDRLLVL